MPDNRPIRMWRFGRKIDQEFDPAEALYRRCEKKDLVGGDENSQEVLSPLSVRFPDFSVNRGKHSEPEDVLIPSVGEPPDIYSQMGIVKFTVGLVRWEHRSDQVKYQMKVEHNPADDNYSHSEVRVYKNGVYDSKLRIKSELMKKEYRARLAREAKIVRRPSV
jgi:hypothetical protein